MKCAQLQLLLFALFTLVSVALFIDRAHADAAPPWYLQNGALKPSGETQIALKELQILLDFTKTPTITSTYMFHNTGFGVESVNVSFPVCEDNYGREAEKKAPCNYDPKSVRVWADEQPIKTRIVKTRDVENETDLISYDFKIAFEAKQKRTVRLGYNPAPGEVYDRYVHDPFVHYSHKLQSAALWKGNIEKLHVNVHYPYEVFSDNSRAGSISNRSFKREGKKLVLTARNVDLSKETLWSKFLPDEARPRVRTLKKRLDADPADNAARFAYAQHMAFCDEKAYLGLMDEALAIQYPKWSLQRRRKILDFYLTALRLTREDAEKITLGEHVSYKHPKESIVTLLEVHGLTCDGDKSCLDHVASLYQEEGMSPDETIASRLVVNGTQNDASVEETPKKSGATVVDDEVGDSQSDEQNEKIASTALDSGVPKKKANLAARRDPKTQRQPVVRPTIVDQAGSAPETEVDPEGRFWGLVVFVTAVIIVIFVWLKRRTEL